MATNFTLNEISSIRLKEQDYHLKNIAFHGTAAEWANHADYVPKAGEIIVYDAATGEEEAKIKVGDGTTVVGELSFITDICARADLLKKKPGRLVEGEELTYIDSEGVETTAVAGVGAEIFNDLNNNAAIGEYSHAEGYQNIAYGIYSHAEGGANIAHGRGSHAEGSKTTAYGTLSHAEGSETTAYGPMSHAEGDNTIAHGYSGSDRYIPQHVQGAYNIEDTEERYIHIVGNGQYGIPSNAHTIDGYGNAWYAGNLYLGGTGMDDATIRGFIVHNSTTDLPAVTNGAILIAFDA